MTQYTISDMMRAYAEDAIELAKPFNVELDYSEASLSHVDRILEEYHKGIPKGVKRLFSKGPSEEQISQMAKVWGGYLGETVIKLVGGEWTISETFDNAIALKLDASEIYPPAKVYKRITNGPEDSLAFYFKVLKQGLTV